MINNKFNKIYFNGCSFTQGGGFESDKYHVKKAYKEQYGFEYKNEKDVSYPTIVQNLLPNIKVINEAKCGTGTERVIRKVWEYIFSNKLKDVKKTIFILELPGATTRLDLFSNTYLKELVGNVYYNSQGKINDTQVAFDWIYGPDIKEEYKNKLRRIIKEYSEEFIHPEMHEKNVAYSLFGLSNFMLMNEIEFYFTGYTEYTEYNLNPNQYYPKFNDEHILRLKINDKYYHNIMYYGIDAKTLIVDEIGANITTDGHPGFQCHKVWAESIVDFLNKKYTI